MPYPSRSKIRIACIEDDATQLALVTEVLTAAGYRCEGFSDADRFLRAMRTQSFDLLLIDWLLPGMSGFNLVRMLRQKADSIPILVVSNLSGEEDIVAGLNAGADDYLVKPVRSNELLARVNALLRRFNPRSHTELEVLRIGNYLIDGKARTVQVGAEVADLSPREFELALLLFRNRGRLIPREEIELSIWGRVIGTSSRTVDTHISKVRNKLALSPKHGVRLVPVYSYGYRFDEIEGWQNPSPAERPASCS